GALLVRIGLRETVHREHRGLRGLRFACPRLGRRVRFHGVLPRTGFPSYTIRDAVSSSVNAQVRGHFSGENRRDRPAAPAAPAHPSGKRRRTPETAPRLRK